MFKYLKQLFLFLLPILKQTTIQVAAEELTKMANPPRRSRYGYNAFERPIYRGPRISPEKTYEEARTGKFQDTRSQHIKKNNFHDVLMVAFDISGPNTQLVHEWLASQMPSAGDHQYGYIKGDPINIDAWWIANDERFDGSDTDSAVFVSKGNQEAARQLLREHGLVD